VAEVHYIRFPGDAGRRARSRAHRVAVVAADRQHRAATEHGDHLEDVMRHHADDAGGGAVSGRTVARPCALGRSAGRGRGRLRGASTSRASARDGRLSAIRGDDTMLASVVRFSGRQMRSQGPCSEEAWSGADLLLVLEIKLRDYEVRMGLACVRNESPRCRVTGAHMSLRRNLAWQSRPRISERREIHIRL
jgi:hypothetical protein